jgi:hypothetical protein
VGTSPKFAQEPDIPVVPGGGGNGPSRLSIALRSAFPAESSPFPRTLRGADLAILLGLFSFSTALLVLRAPVAFSKIFADDGQAFISGAARGFSVGSLFTEYRGYLSVLPRVVAASVVELPVGWWAVGLAIAAVATTAGTACVTFLVARWYVPQRALSGLLGLSVPLVPALRTESINSVANQQFVLVFAAFWWFLAPPRNTGRTLLRAVALLLIGLSAPLMFVLIPLPIARVVRYGRKELPLLVTTVGALLVQGSVHLFWSSTGRGGGVKAVANAAAAYGTDVFEATFGGFDFVKARTYAGVIGVVVAIGAAALGLWWLRRLAAARDEESECGVFARLEFLMVLSLLLSGLFMVVAVQFGGAGSHRYAVAPSLFLCTSLVAAVSRVAAAMFKPTTAHGDIRVRRRISGLAILGVSILIVLGWIRGFSASEYRRSGPTWSVSLAAARSTCRKADHPSTALVPIAPRGRGIGPWHVDVPCAVL